MQRSAILIALAIVLCPPIFTARPATLPATQPSPETPLPAKFRSAARIMSAIVPSTKADLTSAPYREITIPISAAYLANSFAFSTHGWVLDPNAAKPVALCWNGLLYPVEKVGPAVDLDADIKNLLATEKAAVAAYLKIDKTLTGYRVPELRAERDLVDFKQLDLEKAAMLVRVGRLDLAAKVYATYAGELGPPDPQTPRPDPLETLAVDLARSLKLRAYNAFGRGEDPIALAAATDCVTVCDKAAKLLTQRNPSAPAANTTGLFGGSPWPRNSFEPFTDVQSLVADLKRRAATPPEPSVLLHPEKYPDKKARIAALIRDLDRVGNLPVGATDDLQIMPDVMMELLRKEGDDIVDPLLDCYEHDTRLNRCVNEIQVGSFGSPVPLTTQAVGDFALLATEKISGIWADSLPLPPDSNQMNYYEQTAAQAKLLRSLWHKIRKYPAYRRPYDILRDDDLHLFWGDAAAIIVRYDIRPDDPALRAFIHRPEIQPTIHGLLVKRFEPSAAHPDDAQHSHAEYFAELLVDWEGKAALDEIQNLVVRPYFAPWLFAHRAEFGDPKALHEYAGWLRHLSPADLKQVAAWPARILAPLWQFPNDRDIKPTAEWAFESPDSPWSTLLPNADSYDVAGLLKSPLLALPSFRRLVLSLLDRNTNAGIAVVDAQGYLEAQLKPGWNVPLNRFSNIADPAGFVGKPMPLRGCDVVAACLTEVHGTPRFNIFWDQPRRDAAILRIKDFLNRYGDQIATGLHAPESAELRFPILPGPASPDDVAHGRAIFSLNNPGAVKVPLRLPHRARWYTNTSRAVASSNPDPVTGEEVKQSVNFNEGTLWQAEEITVNHKTQRYFGLVWDGGMDRVPAEQIDLLPDYGPGPTWTELPGGVDVKLVPPGTPDPNSYPPQFTAESSGPLRLTIRARNRRAVPQAIPALGPRITVHLAQFKPGASLKGYAGPGEIIPLPPHKLPAEKNPVAVQTLRQPEEEFDTAAIDLQTLFTLKPAANYDLWITVSDPSSHDEVASQHIVLILRPGKAH